MSISDVQSKVPKIDHGKELRKFHNFVKRNLITNFIPPKCKKVVDLGAGMMGDRDKLEKIGCQSVVCIDINPEFINEGKKRIQDNTMQFQWAIVDLSSSKGIDYLVKENILGVPESVYSFSSQFSLGQMVHSNTHLREFVQLISCYLVPGGTWIGTLFDDVELNKLLNGRADGVYRGDSMIVEQHVEQRIEKVEKNEKTDWVAVSVKMPESKTAVSLSESLVSFQDIVRVAQDCGLELVHSSLFSEWFAQDGNQFSLSEKDKAISFVNRSFAFFKTSSLTLEL